MAKRRGRNTPSWQNRFLVGILGLFFVTIIVLSIATTIAQRIAGPAHPTIGAGIAWTIILMAVWLAWVLWRKWHGRRRSRHQHLPELLALNPREFEDAIGALMLDSGFRGVQRIGRAGDLCADLTAFDADGHSVVVQCKRHAPGSKIGSPEIQKFLGMTVVHHRASRGIFATTSEFTGPAMELAKSHPLELWDGAYLSQKLASIHKRQD